MSDKENQFVDEQRKKRKRKETGDVFFCVFFFILLGVKRISTSLQKSQESNVKDFYWTNHSKIKNWGWGFVF